MVLICSIAGGIAWIDAREQAAGTRLFPGGTYAYAEADASGRLFQPLASHDASGASHPIRVSLDAARQAAERGRLPIVLPDNTRYDLRFEREQREPNGDWTLVGRVSTAFGDLASVMTFGPDGVFGTLPSPDGRMFQVTTSHGASRIMLAGGLVPAGIDPSEPAASDIALAPVAKSGGQVRSPQPGTAVPLAQAVDDELHFIDVLGIYTTNLVELRGSASAAETEFTNLFAIANQAHIDSGTTARLRVAQLVLSDYPATEYNNAALFALTTNTLPDGLDVAALREQVSADLVAMLRPYAEGDPTCGIAWLNGAYLDPIGASAERAISVSNVEPCGPLVLAHETGHNLGSTHDAPNATSDGAYPFSMGFRQEGPPGFGTVMSYAGSMPWIGRFSDPSSLGCKAACGTALADNVTSINLMAPRASKFVSPPGTIVVDDAAVVEGDGVEYLTATVRLGRPAGAGGVSFDVEVLDGTATLGEDMAGVLGRFLIPEGARETAFSVEIHGDRDEEEDETFGMALRNVEGAVVHGGEATGFIINDDPAATISGRLEFPADVAAPDSAFLLQVFAASGASLDAVQIEPPLFEYSTEVMRGTGVVLELREHIAGFAEQKIDLGVVDRDVVRDLVVSPQVRVSGRLVFPDGMTVPTTPVDVAIWQTGRSGNLGWVVEAAPPEFEFEHVGFNRGAEIGIEVRPAAPFHSTHVSLGAIDDDVHVEIEVPSTPRLMFISGGTHREFDPPTASGISVMVILSGPAPAGGASVRLTAVSDTAQENADFSAFDVVLSIPEGATTASTTEFLWVLSDDIPEPDETFWFVPSEASGMRPLPGVRGKAVITDDDFAHANTRDVDGDGASDLLWHSRMEERVMWQLMRGSGIVGVDQRYAGGVFRVAAIDDLDSNGDVDLVWEDVWQEDIALWNSDGSAFETTMAGAHPAPGWRSMGSIDVRGNGHAQPLWLDASGTQLRIALQAQDITVDVEVPVGARLVATGDLDGDSHEDLLWQEGTTDQFLVWSGRADGTFAPAVPVQGDMRGGTVFAAADVDGDLRDEVLWRQDDGALLRWWALAGAEFIREGEHSLAPGSTLVAIGDYNADGRADLAWRDARRQQVWLARAWVGGLSDRAIGAHPGGDWAPILPGLPDVVTGAGGNGGRLRIADVDGDGIDDIGWHNPSLGQFDWWRMQHRSRAGLLGRETPRLELLDLGDFDGDGVTDMAWRDRDGDLWLTPAREVGDAPAIHLPASFDLGWRHVGTADVDGDGRDDLLWQHDARGEVQWWSTDGLALEEGGTIDVPAGTRLAVTGDLDGDGRAALVWHDTASGEGIVWALRDGGPVAARFAWPADTSFDLEAAGDVDGDGNDDLLWHDRSGGRLEWWRMSNASRVASHLQATPSGHRIAGVGDFDGDGDVEVLWRNSGRHELAAWAWNGAAFTESRIADEPAAPVDIPPIVAVRRDD